MNDVPSGTTRVAVVGDPDTPTGPAQFGVIQAVAPMVRVEVRAFNKRDAGEIELKTAKALGLDVSVHLQQIAASSLPR